MSAVLRMCVAAYDGSKLNAFKIQWPAADPGVEHEWETVARQRKARHQTIEPA